MNALNTLLEQAEAERNRALTALNQARARCAAAQAQSEQLEAYRADYQRRWSAQFAQGAALEIVRCYQSFSDRLQTAITQQAQAVTQAAGAQAQADDLLKAQELRVASVRKLIERRVKALRQASERREQKADDENAMRMASAQRAKNSTTPGVPT